MFAMEFHECCGFDRVIVYDGHNQQHLLGEYCGDTLPPDLTASSNKMTVVFETDNSVMFPGFVVGGTQKVCPV